MYFSLNSSVYREFNECVPKCKSNDVCDEHQECQISTGKCKRSCQDNSDCPSEDVCDK